MSGPANLPRRYVIFTLRQIAPGAICGLPTLRGGSDYNAGGRMHMTSFLKIRLAARNPETLNYLLKVRQTSFCAASESTNVHIHSLFTHGQSFVFCLEIHLSNWKSIKTGYFVSMRNIFKL